MCVCVCVCVCVREREFGGRASFFYFFIYFFIAHVCALVARRFEPRCLPPFPDEIVIGT